MIVQGKDPSTGQCLTLHIEGELIRSVQSAEEGTVPDFGGPDYHVSSGFFDSQVNGYGGIDFNDQNLTGEVLGAAARLLARTGVTRFLPTLITAPHEVLIRRLTRIADALEHDELLRTMCPGIHLEGPYISRDERPRGAHPREFIRLPDWQEQEIFQEAARGRIRCITLAPELEGAIPFIEKAVREGIVVAIGHTDASDQILEDAFRAGAKLSTHLGNAAGSDDVIEKQLTMRGLMASIIADGIHLSAAVLKRYIEAKGVDRTILTTDSIAGAGAPPGIYKLGETPVEVRPDGSARLAGTSRLAGSTLSMDRAVANVIRLAGVSLASGIRMAGENGRKLFPDIPGTLTPGGPADVVLFKYEGTLVIEDVWIHGEKLQPQGHRDKERGRRM
jgi:N-acetylglucosamine-6-phosphate deacetylase